MEPSVYELLFTAEGIKYQYGFAVGRQRGYGRVAVRLAKEPQADVVRTGR